MTADINDGSLNEILPSTLVGVEWFNTEELT
jgi:hypothetical protein